MQKPRPLSPTLGQQAKPWPIPEVTPAPKVEVEEKTNLLNRREDWVYEPPEEEVEISPPTAEEIEAIRQAAYDEGFQQGKEEGTAQGQQEGLVLGKEQGYQEGYSTGEQAGMDTGRHTVEALIEQWQSLLTHMQTPTDAVNEATREQLTLLAVTLARAVVMCEVQTNHNVIKQALAEGMKALPVNEQEYHIHAHPDDLSILQAQMSKDDAPQRWHFVAAPGMQRGGLEIVTANNAVDVTLERRLRQVLDQFLVNQGVKDA